ncbi:WD40-repeat-containing domain protein [Cantharellus anzutake]|uniref:WD40-repeat-containing domain protein n=1 Tax=Cantharellus anzutake TaxID=1750568 RepID=UPI0019055BE2|nr:WD40-repeat-containing domain protein [Cantharellus anzutake]KAF8325231.1 WD40-repeat-containing domain protein [Cantharellus anzutake]
MAGVQISEGMSPPSMMSLQCIEEIDEDFDSGHPPLIRNALTSGGELSSIIFSQRSGEIEDQHPESFFGTASGLNVLEPIEDNESIHLTTGTLARTFSPHSNANFSTLSVFSTFSNGSVLSIRSSGGSYSLKDLCDNVIDKHLWLQMTRIISTSCFSQYINFVRHRFLVLQLRRPGKRDMWLRIDRRAGISLLSLVQKLGKTRAHDVAQLSASEEALIGKASRENIQNFKKQPFLGDFGVYLRIVSEELLEYKVWPENCWMFCSLLQEHLGTSGDGHYTFGGSIARNIAPLIRGRISERVATNVTPNTIMTALQSQGSISNPPWQPLDFVKPRGWLPHSIGTFLAKIAYPAQGLDARQHSHDILEWITDSSFATHLEKNDLHSRITEYCIEILDGLPEGNVLQLPNPLILNSNIPNLALRIESKISPDVQYAALYGLLHIAEVENPSTELINKLETFIARSAIKWLELLSLLGATKNALIELDKVTTWCENQSQHRNLGKILLQLLLQHRRFAYQYHRVISASAGHIAHSAPSDPPDPPPQRQGRESSSEHLPTVQGHDSGWEGCLNTIPSASLDETVRIWDAVTGEELKVLRHTKWVDSVSFSPDGSRLASASGDKTVRIWNAVTGEELKILRGHTKWVNSVSFSSDGSRIASASSDKTVRIWDTVTGEGLKILRGHTDWANSASFSPDGSRVVSASRDNTVRIWNAGTGGGLNVLHGHTGYVNSVSFAPDGLRLASASRDNTVRIWDAMTGEELKVLHGHADWVYSVSFSSDGSRIASAAMDKAVRIWNVVTGEELKVLRGDSDWVNSVSFSPDGSRIASASHDNTVRILDAIIREDLKVPQGHTDWVKWVSFSPDGSRVASASRDKTARIWDAATGEELKVLRGHTRGVNCISFSSEGSRVASASGDDTVRIWDVVTGEELKVLRGHTAAVNSVSFSFDGRRAASASDDKTVRLWNVMTGEETRVLRGHTHWINSVSCSSDGSRIASASSDRTVRIWDAVTWAELKVLEGHTSEVKTVSFSFDGSRLASASDDNTVRIWDVVTGEVISVRKHSSSFDIHMDSFSDPTAIRYECSFAEVKHDELNGIYVFIGACGAPHYIAPSYIGDIISTWKVSRDRQTIAIGMHSGGLLIVHAPKTYHCVRPPTLPFGTLLG